MKQSIKHSSKQKTTRFETKEIIVFWPPKKLLLSDKKHLINVWTTEDQKSTKYWQRKVQNSVPSSPTAIPQPRKEKYKILCPVTTNSSLLPPPLTRTHTHTHTDSFPTYPQPPLETLLTPLLRVFETCYKLNESL